MKLTSILLLTGLLHAEARGLAQTVTYTGNDVPLTQVFSIIKRQTGYLFFYSPQDLEGSKPVTCVWKNLPLRDALDNLFAAQPLSYAIEGNTVVVSKQERVEALDIARTAPAPDADLTVIVFDDEGKPLVGASIRIKESNRGMATDERGRAVFKGIRPGATLIVSYMGFASQEIKLRDKREVEVRMVKSANPLDQAQVIAYGTTTQRLSAGDVSTVPAEVIAKQPVGNALLALKGEVPGLFIKQSTGFPGSGVSVQVIGQTSIAQNNDPLYVIDGVPYYFPIPPYYITGVQQTPSLLAFVNPDDIESISVLKDADATSIYGSRAANGAILITTKKGKAGPSRVSLNVQNGWTKNIRRSNVLNTPQYLQMRRQAFANDGLKVPSIVTSPTDVNYDINGLWDTTRNTDWQKVLLGGTAGYTDMNVSISGGTVNTTFVVGATYHREGTIYPSNQFNDQKGAIHYNLTHNSSDGKFTVVMSSNYEFDQNRLPSSDFTNAALLTPPDAPAIYNPDGSLNWALDPSGNSTWQNPYAFFYEPDVIKTNNLISNLTVGYRILKNLEFKTDLAYTHMEDNDNMQFPFKAFPPERRTSNSNRFSIFSHGDVSTWDIQPQLRYNTHISAGRLEALAGLEGMQTNESGQRIIGSGFTSDLLLGDISSAATVTTNSTALTTYKYSAGFGRISYLWMDTYGLYLNGRRDGSSRFAPDSRFHDFWSVAGFWTFSHAPAVKRMLPQMSYGKLSMSYGTTGNDKIGDYLYLNTYRAPVSISNPYQGAGGLLPTGLTNPYLQWEESRKWNGKLDLGFFEERIRASADYFRWRSSNQLLFYTLSMVTGFGNIQENWPATVQNTGWEFTLNTVNVKTRDFNWSTNFNMTVPRNKLVAFPNLAKSSYASSLVIGQPVNIQKVFRYLGVDPATGGYMVANAKGDPTKTPNFSLDRTVIENINPSFYGGIGNTLLWKGLQLDFTFYFIKQIVANNYGLLGAFPGVFSSGSGSTPFGNQPTFVLNNVWQHPGDQARLERLSTSTFQYNNATNSSDQFCDGSYIQLQNVNLSYLLPQVWSKKAGMKSCQIYGSGQNLFTITPFRGIDPSTSRNNGYFLPPLRTFTVGIKAIL
ncbi:MAG: SusC/RagA family TonB-linked outer membrane protein [Bacteroidota bacterium]|nr:SusC/RagA family TonB-linked outer membrane protein [Bacteroidota bacterium]MDP4258046.1 SusC/RagA family TonB-linked outer membrane protein [Bacteroidota bacterium]